MTRIIVCDTGPLLHLSEAGAAHLLPLAGKVLIPPLVATEFEANAQGWSPPQWVQITVLEKLARRNVESGFQIKYCRKRTKQSMRCLNRDSH